MNSLKSTLKNIYDNERWFLFVVFMLAYFLRVAYILYNYPGLLPGNGEHVRIAKNILSGRGFSFAPYWMPDGGPTAAVSPFYPYFLALIFGSVPILKVKLLTVQLFQAVLSSITCIIGYFIAKRIFNRETAAWAALLMAVSIFLIKTTLVVYRTTFFVFFLSLVVLGSLKLVETTRLDHWIGYGMLAGVAMLNSPEISAFLPLVLIWTCYHSSMTWRPAIKRLVPMFLMIVFIVGPWTLRNYMLLKRFIPISSSFGANLWEGNNPYASGSEYLYNYGYSRDKLGLDFKIRTSPDMNEPERIDILKKDALMFIRQNPVHFLKLKAKSFFYFWFTHYNWENLPGNPPNKITHVATLMMNILAVIGITLSFRKPGTHLLILLFICFSLIYTITHASITYRYRMPLDPYLLMFAAAAINRVKSALLPPLTK